MKYCLLLALLCVATACAHVAAPAPPGVDLSGVWVLDATRSDAIPSLDRRRSRDDEQRFTGPLPPLAMLTATQMTISQDAVSMGIDYPNQPYRDLKWGLQQRDLYKVDARWDGPRLVVETASDALHIREIYVQNGDTLVVDIDVRGRDISGGHATRVFEKAGNAQQSAPRR
jgi:hypothetical protein